MNVMIIINTLLIEEENDRSCDKCYFTVHFELLSGKWFIVTYEVTYNVWFCEMEYDQCTTTNYSA